MHQSSRFGWPLQLAASHPSMTAINTMNPLDRAALDRLYAWRSVPPHQEEELITNLRSKPHAGRMAALTALAAKQEAEEALLRDEQIFNAAPARRPRPASAAAVVHRSPQADRLPPQVHADVIPWSKLKLNNVTASRSSLHHSTESTDGGPYRIGMSRSESRTFDKDPHLSRANISRENYRNALKAYLQPAPPRPQTPPGDKDRVVGAIRPKSAYLGTYRAPTRSRPIPARFQRPPLPTVGAVPPRSASNVRLRRSHSGYAFLSL